MAAASAWPECQQFLLLSPLGQLQLFTLRDAPREVAFCAIALTLGVALQPPRGRTARSSPDKVLLPGTVVE